MKSIGGWGQSLKEISSAMCVEALCREGFQGMAQAALAETGRQGRRLRVLHPLFVLWLVLILPLHRSLSIPNVVATLISGLRGRFPRLALRGVTESALAHARCRLSVAPLVNLFRRMCRGIAAEPLFHGLRVSALDGTNLDMPDTPANVKVYGKTPGSRGESAFPRIRVVALLEVASRRIKAFRMLPWRISETRAVPVLLAGIGRGDLVLADRGLYAFAVLLQVLSQKGDFLLRVSKSVKIKKKKALGPGDWIGVITHRLPLAEIPPLAGLKVLSRGSKYAWVRLQVRVIEFKVLPGGEANRLVTSLIDPSRIEARELAALYHRRWDIELAYDEVKTHLSRTAKGTAGTVLRSKNPRLVAQEVYALMIVYNLVRGLIWEAAQTHGVAADEISFVDALTTIQLAIVRLAGAPTERLPRLYRQLLADVAQCRNRRPRRKRQYPRVVRIKMSNFPLKRPGDIGKNLDFAAGMALGVAA